MKDSDSFYSPEAFEKLVKAALDRSDEYVWIYSKRCDDRRPRTAREAVGGV